MINQRGMRKLFIIFGLLMALSCKKDNHVVPYVYVDFYIDISSTQYIDLNAPGGYIYVTGGANGIIIRRNDTNEFVAFDRTCTYHVSENRRVVVDDYGLYASDSVCGSKYLLLDGSPDPKGPSKIPLKQYRTAFTEGSTYLHVYN